MGLIDKFLSKPANSIAAAKLDFQRHQIAVCALLIEAASADDSFTKDESVMLINMLKAHFDFSDKEVDELTQLAEEALARSIDTHSIADAVNKAYSDNERIELMENLWELVYSDGYLSGHEDHFAHKVSFILGLTHRQMIDAKLKVLAKIKKT